MVIGDDVAAMVDDDARAHAIDAVLRGRHGEGVARSHIVHGALAMDINDRSLHPLDEIDNGCLAIIGVKEDSFAEIVIFRHPQGRLGFLLLGPGRPAGPQDDGPAGKDQNPGAWQSHVVLGMVASAGDERGPGGPTRQAQHLRRPPGLFLSAVMSAPRPGH